MAEKQTAPPPEVAPVVTPAPVTMQQVLAEQQAKGKTAIDRQLTKKPPRQKQRIEVQATIQGQPRGGTFEALDEAEAWALFCDTNKLPEASRSPQFARPQFKVLGPAQSV